MILTRSRRSCAATSVAVLGLVLILGASAPAEAKRRSKKPKGVTVKGAVATMTHQRAYLHLPAGRAALHVGDKVTLYAKRRRRGTCVVEHVSSTRAACSLPRRVPDDIVRFVARVPPPPAKDPADAAPTPLRPGPIIDGRAPLAASPVAKVAYTTERVLFRKGVSFPVEVALSQRSSGQGLSMGRMFHRTRVAVGVHGAQLYVPGLRLHLRANVDGAVVPAGARYRKNENLRLEVHQAAISYRHPETLFTGAIGRFTPWVAPGVPLLDGAQAGIHLWSGLLEVGAYAGSQPSPLRLLPRFDHLVGGAYWSARYGQDGWWVGHRGRVGVVTNLGLSLRTEAEAHLTARYGRLVTAAAGLRGGLGIDGLTPGIDLGYVQAQSQPGFGFRLAGGYRYTAPGFSDDRPGRWPTIFAGLHHANASVSWEKFEWLGISLRAMAAATPAWALRGVVGPEVGVPRLLGGLFGAFVGWQEGVGHDAGRMVYSRAYLRPGFGAYLSARAFYLDQYKPLSPYRAAGGSVLLEERLSWFSVWLRGRGEVPLPDVAEYAQPSSALVNVLADMGVSASF